MNLSAGKLQVKGEQETFALVPEHNHLDELYHALKGLGRGHSTLQLCLPDKLFFPCSELLLYPPAADSCYFPCFLLVASL